MASTLSTQTLLTFDDYLAYDDGTDSRYELVDGELIAMPPESPENLDLARFLLLQFLQHLPLQRIVYNTEVEVTGRRARCRIPDLLVHSEESLAALTGARRATIDPRHAAPGSCGRSGEPWRGEPRPATIATSTRNMLRGGLPNTGLWTPRNGR
jgi:Uma2 family endonuclease